MPEHRIETLVEKKLMGKHLTMSFTDNKTGELWRSFMHQRSELSDTVGSDLYSLQLYSADFFKNFNPASPFEKWAAIEVNNFDNQPDTMETFTLVGGLYAVFIHKGSNNDTSTFQYIFNEWLPTSAYILDDRPHFELLGKNYKNMASDSEEEIWIPIRLKP